MGCHWLPLLVGAGICLSSLSIPGRAARALIVFYMVSVVGRVCMPLTGIGVGVCVRVLACVAMRACVAQSVPIHGSGSVGTGSRSVGPDLVVE